MPQIILHTECDGRSRTKAKLVQALRNSLIQRLGLKQDQGQVIIYETLPVLRAVDPASAGMVFVEVKMVEGREASLKAALCDDIVEAVAKALEIEEDRVLCLFEEHARSAYVRGKREKHDRFSEN